MIQMNFQQTLADRQASQAEQRDAEWRRYVIAVEATAVAPDPDSVLAKLEQVGRTAADLDAAIRKLRERRRLVGLIAESPAHAADYQRHSAALQLERERFRPLLDAHEKLVGELRWAVSHSQSCIRDAGSADMELRASCSPEVLAAIQAGNSRLRELDERILQNGYEQDRISSDVARLACESNQSPEMVAENRRKSAELQAKVERLMEAKDALAAQRPALLQSLEDLRVESLSVESI